jgi:hypothetical protein
MNKLYGHDSTNNTQRLIRCSEDGNLVMSTAATGTQGGLWNGASVVADDESNAVDLESYNKIAVFGSSDATVTLTIQCSADNSTYYSTGNTIEAVSGDFYACVEFPARYVRLLVSGTATITATVSAKA